MPSLLCHLFLAYLFWKHPVFFCLRCTSKRGPVPHNAIISFGFREALIAESRRPEQARLKHISHTGRANYTQTPKFRLQTRLTLLSQSKACRERDVCRVTPLCAFCNVPHFHHIGMRPSPQTEEFKEGISWIQRENQSTSTSNVLMKGSDFDVSYLNPALCRGRALIATLEDRAERLID